MASTPQKGRAYFVSSPADLRLLSRRELQEVAKRRGVRANAKSSEIISALESLRHADRAAPEPDPAPAPPEAAAPVEAADVGLDLVEALILHRRPRHS